MSVNIAPTIGKSLPLTPLPLSYCSYTYDLGKRVWMTNAWGTSNRKSTPLQVFEVVSTMHICYFLNNLSREFASPISLSSNTNASGIKFNIDLGS